MNSSDIRNQLRAYKGFLGVFPCDAIPPLKPGQALIANTDPHDKPGQHWVALYCSPEGGLEYFDSFGLPPMVDEIRKYINKSKHSHFSCSSVQLQHEASETCGNHCIAFVKHRLMKQPFTSLLAHFTNSQRNNDIKVFDAIRL